MNRGKIIPNSRKPKTSKNKYFSDFIQASLGPVENIRRTSKKKIMRKNRNKKWKSTDNKKKNHTGCFSNFEYISHPYKGAYDKVGVFLSWFVRILNE